VNCLSAGKCFITKFTSTFSPTLSGGFIFHIGVIQKDTLLQSIPHHDVTHCSLIVTENKRLMELITAACCWKIINNFPCMNRSSRREHNAIKPSTKLITPLDPKRYQSSGIMWVVGKIHNRLAAGGALAAMKHSAVNRSTKVRTSLFVTILKTVLMAFALLK
jgi:hypothetical protein